MQVQAFTDARGALAEFVTLDGLMAALDVASTPDDVNAALLAAGLRDTSDFQTRSVSCRFCHGSGKLTEREREAVALNQEEAP